MSDVAPNPQAPIIGVPVGAGVEAAPFAYASPAQIVAWLAERWPQATPTPAGAIGEGTVLAASMMLDEEGPWQGVKFLPTQERSWPRTFRYGWPNIIAAPAPIMVALQFPGAWNLNYEQVVPVQVIDWVALECWRMVMFPFDREVTQEAATGASAHYSAPAEAGGWRAQLDRIQASLLSPFLLRTGRTSPFQNFGGL